MNQQQWDRITELYNNSDGSDNSAVYRQAVAEMPEVDADLIWTAIYAAAFGEYDDYYERQCYKEAQAEARWSQVAL
jgi:hypothetical protein